MFQTLAPLAGCALIMLVCMAVMGAGARKRPNDPTPPASTDEINALRDEVARLRQLEEERRTTPQEPAP
jgi:hypothetical protein